MSSNVVSFLFSSRPDDVNALMSVKLALKYSGRDVSAMKAIAQASKKRSLADFQQVLIFILINHSNFLVCFFF